MGEVNDSGRTFCGFRGQMAVERFAAHHAQNRCKRRAHTDPGLTGIRKEKEMKIKILNSKALFMVASVVLMGA